MAGANYENAQRLKHEQNASKKVQSHRSRLFFCGFPYSGKTTLSKTLVNCSKTTLCATKCIASRLSATSCFPWAVRSSVQDQTRGIVVTFLEKDGLKVSLWDLAGQPEYHCLHDHMFPIVSYSATPALFLFLWNPIQLDPENDNKIIMDEDGRTMKKTTDMFKTEFKYWLKFIASKNQQSEKYKPTVFIVLTRGDLTSNTTKALVEDTIINLQREFEDYIHISTDRVFDVDARECGNVEELALAIFSHVKTVFGSAPLVYEACEIARKKFSELVQNKLIPPLVSKEKFSVLCHKFLSITSEEMQETIAETLNNSGDLIYLTSVECVIMDIHWFCHEIMGGLLDHCMKNEHTVSGFLKIRLLEELLEDAVNRGKGKYARLGFSRMFKFSNVRGEDLVNLLVGVQLACYNRESLIFIPASLYKSGRDIDPRKYLTHDEHLIAYAGRRLTCKDSKCTLFSPRIFHQLQIMFTNIFSFRGVPVLLEQNVIAFVRAGRAMVFIEFCSQGTEDHFIDILFHSFVDLERALECVHEEVTDRIVTACGIQGVELVQWAILPACVKRCDPLKDRGPHATPVERLKDAVIMYLERRGFQCAVEEDGFRGVLHTWQSTRDEIPVVDILGQKETLKVVDSYTNSLSLAAEHSLNTNVEGTNFTMSSKSLQIVESYTHSLSVAAKESLNTANVEGTKFTMSGKSLQKQLSRMTIKEASSGNSVQYMHNDLQNKFENLRNDVLPRLVEKMKHLLNERRLGELPRMYVVTRNDGAHMQGRKLLAANNIVPGLQNVRLELLCECRGQPHFVDSQCGLSFARVEDGSLVKRGLPYIHTFLQTANVLVKVAAYVAVSLGDKVPDFAEVLASIEDIPEFLSSPLSWSCPEAQYPSAYTVSTSRTNLHQSQQWLCDVLSSYKCSTDAQIREVFSLSPVQCNGEIAWLCEKHKHEGDTLLA